MPENIPIPTEPTRYTVTAALPYANGPLHIGHLGGCYLPADIYVRYLRSMGKEVLFLCGSDEYGVAITIKARKEGITPQEVIDKYHPMLKDTLEEMGIDFDIYSRTSEPVHHKTAQEFFTKFNNEGKLEKLDSEQYYDEEAGMFLADRYILGTCPVCGNPNAYGDQCENCGTSLSPDELKDVRSSLSGSKPVKRKTSHWYLPLERFQPVIDQYIKSRDNWKVNVLGQCNSWLASGLHARSITRDLNWGIPVPLPQAAGKVLYVWFDAPIGYISAAKKWAEKVGKPDAWKKYWLKEEFRAEKGEVLTDEDSGKTQLIHFIGKDNIVFHCIIFPCMLIEHGEYLPGADYVPANEFVNLEGEKISTSRNWAVWVHEYLDDPFFKDKVDVLRYVLASTLPETKDSDFSWKDFQQRNNSELVGILGNYVNRVLTLAQKYFDNGIVPDSASTVFEEGGVTLFYNTYNRVRNILQNLGEYFRFKAALEDIIDIARIGNQYLQQQEPWHKDKTEKTKKIVLYNSLQHLAVLASMLEPFLPITSKKIFEMLGSEKKLTIEEVIKKDASVTNSNRNGTTLLVDFVKPGTQLPPPYLLFQKIEDDVIQQQLDKLAASKVQHKPVVTELADIPQHLPTLAEAKAAIDYEAFAAMDLRIGTITHAEAVPKADKLLRLTVDVGLDLRTIVSGIAEHFKVEELPGQRVLVLANLTPRKLRGIESQGMILLAETPDGKLSFVAPPAGVANGSVVR